MLTSLRFSSATGRLRQPARTQRSMLNPPASRSASSLIRRSNERCSGPRSSWLHGKSDRSGEGFWNPCDGFEDQGEESLPSAAALRWGCFDSAQHDTEFPSTKTQLSNHLPVPVVCDPTHGKSRVPALIPITLIRDCSYRISRGTGRQCRQLVGLSAKAAG